MIQVYKRLYGFKLPQQLIAALRIYQGSVRGYLGWFLRTRTYRIGGKLVERDRLPVRALQCSMAGQIVVVLLLITDWFIRGTVGHWAFGTALLVGYPVITAYGFALVVLLSKGFWFVLHPKQFGKTVVAHILEQQVVRLRVKRRFTVVAVAGSVGKTTTKMAIAQLLGHNLRVRYQAGNYNDRVTVPLVFFCLPQPSLLNPFAWMRAFGEIAASLHHPYPYDVVVVELGTDGPGQMERFAYIRPDITVLTAITPEHMVNFGSIDAVAAEETSVFEYSRHVLVNTDLVEPKYLVGKTFVGYSQRKKTAHSYYGQSSKLSLGGQFLQIHAPSGGMDAYTRFVGEQGAASVVAAAAVADILGMKRSIIAEAIDRLEPFAGRMQVLEGIKGSRLIDDTYNSSPVAAKAALDVLYGSRATQRIAVLGSMNEMGGYAREAHKEVGMHCNPKKLDFVLTLGRDAERWIAPAARDAGCVVRSFSSQAACAAFIRKHLKQGAVVLVKGSQNGVFAEEVVKQLLAHPVDAKKLVRQSSDWLRRKVKQQKTDTL